MGSTQTLTRMTPGERQKVADRLRANATKRGVTLDYFGSQTVNSWRLLLYSIGCESSHQEDVFNFLADLIDPTCHVDLTDSAPTSYEVRRWECGRCGHSFEDVYGSYSYCPQCGCRILDDEDETGER